MSRVWFQNNKVGVVFMWSIQMLSICCFFNLKIKKKYIKLVKCIHNYV